MMTLRTLMTKNSNMNIKRRTKITEIRLYKKDMMTYKKAEEEDTHTHIRKSQGMKIPNYSWLK